MVVRVHCQRVELWMQNGASSTRSGDFTRKKRAMKIRTQGITTRSRNTRKGIPLCNEDTRRSCRWLVFIHCTRTCCWHRRLFTTTNLYKYITTFVSWGFARKRRSAAIHTPICIRDHTTTVNGCTICISYVHEKRRYETTKRSTGRKNRYEMNWTLWWNRGVTTTTDTICADNLNVDAWLIAKKRIHHNNVGTIWRRLIAWIEMHTKTPT